MIMGIYLDPGNESFRSAISSDIYVDKTGLLEILNDRLGKEKRFFAVSRARRFGKSMVAGMIKAYYSIGCDSREIFAPYRIARSTDFEEHLNKYHVLHIDMATYLNAAGKDENPVDLMNDEVLKDFREAYPELMDGIKTLPKAAEAVWKKDGIRFVVIIDECECIIRDAKNDVDLITHYLKYLRGFFKTEESKEFLALGYITGILPIKKFDGESAMNNFIEYTMISPKQLAPYFGFSDQEVQDLCVERPYMSMDDIRRWYDGYLMKHIAPDRTVEYLHMYNPNSLVCAFTDGECESYWKNTGAFAGLNDYIGLNMDGLKDTVLKLLAGESCPVDTSGYQNDLTSFKCRDDVLTALIHMGYLGYDVRTEEAYIPNEEVREVFSSAIKVGDWTEIAEALRGSDELLKATWAGDAEKVAVTIEKSHQDYTSILEYHDENSLALAIQMSYYTARKHYVVVRELPAGKGFADIAFIPKKGSDKPAMIVELKWNDDADSAISQIHDRNYAGQLRDYGSEILLVGISYDKAGKKYGCIIESIGK